MSTTVNAQAFRTLGAVHDRGATAFRVWAPEASHADLVLRQRSGGHELHPLTRSGDGYWTGRLDAIAPGAHYKFRLNRSDDSIFPDPASRFQPEGVHGWSEVVDPSVFAWTDSRWSAPPLPELVIYELHVGTFSPEGTFAGASDLLPRLLAVGVNAIELMPVADFPGDRNWGYDGVALFAPARCYGRPDDLRGLIDCAHRLGLAVLLDVVYNHLGPDGAYANAFSPYYFTDAHESPWGRGVNLDGPHSAEVRRFFIENALHWTTEYHIDGLRLDATHALRDDSPRHFLQELTGTVRRESPRPVILVAEDHRNLAPMLRPVSEGGYGIDAVWADDFHHEVRVHTAGDRDSYYADFTGAAGDLAATLRQGWFFTGQWSSHLREPRGTDPSALDPWQFVICIQNHDQIGNRADGARLNHEIDPAVYRAASALLLLAPETPLLFMGQEWAASSPFLFFTDHHDELGRLVTMGRREEFGAFTAFTDATQTERIPDPQRAETFERSRLRWREAVEPPHDGTLRLYQRLIAVRRDSTAIAGRRRASLTVEALDAHTIAIEYGGSLLVIARLSGGSGRVRVPNRRLAQLVLTTEDPAFAADGRIPVARQDRADLEVVFEREGAVVVQVSRVT